MLEQVMMMSGDIRVTADSTEAMVRTACRKMKDPIEYKEETAKI
jgi:hypothetical protein